ncbi:MAG: hypothetical protein B6I36_08030 [Desulfobacteraceae bacterium 4572_35.1]|nr:MAG: hypothetical protein B6I36_08030 [Desulfobacteraceae bacterium 4572_35.1]
MESTDLSTQGKSKKQIWQRITLYVVLCSTIAVLVLPVGLRLAVTYWLNKQPSIVAQIGNIDLNLFTATVAVDELIIQHQAQTVLSAQHAELQLYWWPLWQHRLHVHHLSVENGFIQLNNRDDAPPMIAGFPLSTAASPTEEPPSPSTWEIDSGNISISNFQIKEQFPDFDLDLVIEQMTTTPMVSWQPLQTTAITAALNINDAPVQFNGKLQPFAPWPSGQGTLSIHGFNLETMAPLLAHHGLNNAGGKLDSTLQLTFFTPENNDQGEKIEIKGNISARELRGSNAQMWLRNLALKWDGTTTICVGQQPASVTLSGHLSLDDGDIDIQSGYRLHQEQLRWNGNLKFAPATTGKKDQLTIIGDLDGSNTTIIELDQQRQLAHIAQFNMKDIQLNNSQQGSCANLHLLGIQAFQRTHGDNSVPASMKSHIVNLTAANLGGVTFEKQQLRVKKLHLAGLQLTLARTTSGALEINQWQHSTNTPAPGSTPQLAIIVDHIQLDQHSNIDFIDHSLGSTPTIHLGEIDLSLSNLDSTKINQPSSMTLSGKFDDYSTLQLSGDLHPFATPVSFDIAGSIKEFHLPDISGYTEKSSGYAINQGQLNVDLHAPCINGELNMDTDLFLNKLRMKPLSTQADANAAAAIGMPVNLALSLLRDGDDNINIRLPVRGNLHDPSFKIGSILSLAVRNALKNTVMLTLAPLGVIAKTGQLIGLQKSLRFKRLTFYPATGNMTAEAEQYLNKVAQLVRKRPGLTLTLASTISAEDIAQLQKELLKQQQAEQQKPLASLTPPTVPPLLLQSLLEQRTKRVKKQLLAQQVASAQLLVAKPQLNIVDTPPGVDLILQ